MDDLFCIIDASDFKLIVDKNQEFLSSDFNLTDFPLKQVSFNSIKMINSKEKLPNVSDYVLIYSPKLVGRLCFGKNAYYNFDLENNCLVIRTGIVCELDTDIVYICDIWDKTKYIIVEHPDLRKTFIAKSDIIKFPFENSIKCFMDTSDIVYTKYTSEEFENIAKIYKDIKIDLKLVDYEQIDYYFSLPQYTLMRNNNLLNFKQNNKDILLFGNESEFNLFESIEGLVPFRIIILSGSIEYDNFQSHHLRPIMCVISGKIVFADFAYDLNTSDISYYYETMHRFSQNSTRGFISNLKEIEDGEEISVFSTEENFIEGIDGIPNKVYEKPMNRFIISNLSEEINNDNIMQNFHMNVVNKYTDHEMIEMLTKPSSYYNVVVKKCSDIETKIYSKYENLRLIEYVETNINNIVFPDDVKLGFYRNDYYGSSNFTYKTVYGYFKF